MQECHLDIASISVAAANGGALNLNQPGQDRRGGWPVGPRCPHVHEESKCAFFLTCRGVTRLCAWGVPARPPRPSIAWRRWWGALGLA